MKKKLLGTLLLIFSLNGMQRKTALSQDARALTSLLHAVMSEYNVQKNMIIFNDYLDMRKKYALNIVGFCSVLNRIREKVSQRMGLCGKVVDTQETDANIRDFQRHCEFFYSFEHYIDIEGMRFNTDMHTWKQVKSNRQYRLQAFKDLKKARILLSVHKPVQIRAVGKIS